jgi:hypothetical protein
MMNTGFSVKNREGMTLTTAQSEEFQDSGNRKKTCSGKTNSSRRGHCISMERMERNFKGRERGVHGGG